MSLPNVRELGTVLALVSVAVAGAGCGGGMAPAAKSAPPEDVPSAERDLRAAEHDLESALAAAPAPAPTTTAAPTGGAAQMQSEGKAPGAPPAAGASPPPPPVAAERRSEATPAREAAKKEEERPVSREPSPCAVACRALASMRRAADTICRLAGSDDPRCVDAQKRVSDGAARAGSCGCDARGE